MAQKDQRRLALEAVLGSFQSLADSLWSKVAAMHAATGRVRILFTSAEAGAGTTVVAASTAVALARTLRLGVRVVEANLESPGLAACLDVPGAPGLSDMLDGRALAQDCWHEVHSVQGLAVVPAGRARPTVAGELASEGGTRVLDALLGSQGLTLVDAPPLLGHSYARPLLTRVDGVVLVLRARSTRKDAAEATLRMLEGSGSLVLGSVLNRHRSDMPFGIMKDRY